MTDLTEAAAAVRRQHPIYRNRNTGVTWQVEMQDGTHAWLRDIVGHAETRRLDELANRETWERLA
ncbi:hypothetical protein [Azotobacter chroococcum]|uniref:Uncharacterized protein n=1 Tax=Azotobacter chroococcum TaxID=353 RepID=A0AAQ0C0S4_9GAMM|nr:hypothetical protein [Azotobacter chroococcum]QQE90434.1 hypothetical protein GKQ51_09250 [Azotobacter chroococcum]